MTKKILRIIKPDPLKLVLFFICLLLPSWALAYQVVSKTVSEETVTRGAVLQTVRMTTNEGPLNVYILKADLSDPYLKVDTIVGADGTLAKNQTVTAMAGRAGAVAAVNGDFFQMKESGRPIGLLYQGGRLIESPALRSDMYGFAVTKDKLPILEVFQFSGQVTAGNGKSFPLSGINKPGYLVMSDASSDVDSLLLYNSLWGPVSRGRLAGLTGVVEAVVKNGVVQQVLTDQPGVPIPPDGYVLRGHGQAARFILENLPAGSKVSYTYSVMPQGDKLFAAVGGQALLVEEGRLPAYFTQNIAGKHARTAAGVSKDGKTLYLVAVEKQSASDGTVVSRGMTQEELAEFLISIGVWRAVNLDGGGSTTLAARHLGDFNVSLINRPQGKSQRSVPNAIGIFSTAPPGKLKGLAISGPSVLIAGTKGEFTAKGYDQYYNPVRIEPEKVSWSAAPAAGKFEGSVFLPERGGTVTVQAALGSATGAAAVRVIGPEMLAGLVVSPSSISVEPGQSVELSVQVKTKEGETFALKSEDVRWAVDGTAGVIANGKFTAAAGPASGKIEVSFQGLSASVPVSVRLPSVELQAEPGKDSEAVLDGRVRVRFPAGSANYPVKIQLSNAGIPVDLPEGFVPVEAITVTPEEGQKAVLNAPWRLSWNYSTAAVNARPAVLLWDPVQNKWREQPAKVEGEGQARIISAAVWGFGKLVLVDDRRPPAVFKDTEGHWAASAISNLAGRGVINGFPDGTFGPAQTVTRAQFVAMLAAALQWATPESMPAFKDAVPAWAMPAVAAAVARGVISGYPDGTFAPDARITRSEMAVMICRALALEGAGGSLQYRDSAAIPDFARDAVARASAAGLLQGSEGYFRPWDGATRAEAAVVISRVLALWLERGS
ncbi:MAG: hypothetical protein HPY89_03505 [Pelotomaculum sp.]|nr:hypothetical protein [Pelotomaculum sp.]